MIRCRKVGSNVTEKELVTKVKQMKPKEKRKEILPGGKFALSSMISIIKLQ